MNNTEFDNLVDATLLQIEDAIETSAAEIDFDTIAGILTLEFDDGSKIIINRQLATQQIWVAAKAGGFHFDYSQNGWLDERDQCDLQARLNHLVSDQAGVKLNLNFEN